MLLRPAAAPGRQLGLVGRQLQHVAGKRRHLAPGHRAVGALPQAGLARAEEEDAAVVGIDRHPLAVAAAGLVAAKLDRDVGALEGVPLIGRAQDRAVRNLGRRVRAAGQVDLAWIRRIDGDALHAHQIEVRVRHPVEHRLPAVCLRVPPVGAADVGARVEDVLGGRMKHEAVDETAADDLDALPGVGDGRRLVRGHRRKRRQHREAEPEAERFHGRSFNHNRLERTIPETIGAPPGGYPPAQPSIRPVSAVPGQVGPVESVCNVNR